MASEFMEGLQCKLQVCCGQNNTISKDFSQFPVLFLERREYVETLVSNIG